MSWNWESMLLLDRMNDLSGTDPMYAFALDELLCRSAGKGGPAICHLWRHSNAFVMGLRDSRMPFAAKASHWLESSGWRAVVRHSGGLAVPLDAGVVNVSLILPKSSPMKMHYRNDFERMYELIARALQGTGKLVEKGEIAGAYCPGDFDLSINGSKFCGIAQRRQAHATIVQAFVVAEGSGRARSEFVRSFYEVASGGDDTLGHPIVEGDSTASLEELAGLGPRAAHAFAEAVKETIRNGQSTESIAEASTKLRMPAPDEIAAMIASLRSRYEIL